MTQKFDSKYCKPALADQLMVNYRKELKVLIDRKYTRLFYYSKTVARMPALL